MITQADRMEIQGMIARYARGLVADLIQGHLALPVFRPGTVAVETGDSTTVQVRVDGDSQALSAINVGASLPAGARVLVLLAPPQGVFVLGPLTSAATVYAPTWTGAVTNPTGVAGQGSYHLHGGFCTFSSYFLVSAFGAGAGDYGWTVPFQASSNRRQAVPVQLLYNTGANRAHGVGILEPGDTQVTHLLMRGDGAVDFLVSPGTPGFGAGDWIAMGASYRIA